MFIIINLNIDNNTAIIEYQKTTTILYYIVFR